MSIPKLLHRDRAKFGEKSLSSHGRGSGMVGGPGQLRRPMILGGVGLQVSPPSEGKTKLAKFLLNVTIQGILGAVQVLMTQESTVADLIAAAVKQYAKEGRRPVLSTSDPAGFDLHYSPFSLESLVREEKLVVLGSRNFFLCNRKTVETAADGGLSSLPANTGFGMAIASSCNKQEEKAATNGFGLPWLKFIGLQ